MRRFFKWFIRILGVAGVVLSIGLLFYILSARGIAERQILQALRDLGIDDASVEVRSIGTNHLQITHLNMGDQAGLRIGAVGVDYALSLTGQVQVKTIDISGAQLDLRLRDGKLDIGPLANFKSSDSQSYADDELPFDVLKLRAASVRLEWNGRHFTLPVQATLTHQGSGVCDVDATITLLGLDIPVKGTIDFTAPEADSTQSVRPMADGISFNLNALFEGTSILIAGHQGGTRDPFSLMVSVPNTEQNTTAPFQCKVVLLRRDEGSKITVRASGQSEQFDLLLAQFGLISRGLHTTFDAELDLTTAKGTAKINLAADTVSVQASGTAALLHKPVFAMDLTADWATDLHIQSSATSGLSFDRIDLPHETQRRSIDGGSLLTHFDLMIPRDGTAGRWPRLALDVGIKAWAAHLGANEIAADESAIAMTLTTDENHQLVASGTFTIANGRFASTASGVVLAGINAVVPVRLGSSKNENPPVKPSFEIQKIQYKDDTFAALTGTMSLVDGLLLADLDWPIFDQAPAKVTASIDIASGFAGRVTAKVHDLHITDEKLVATKLRAAKAFQVTGYFGLDAEIAFDGSGVTPRVVLTVRDATFASGAIDFTARGINTTITLNSFAPLSTLPNQRLAASEGNIGKLQFSNAILNFRLDAIDAMVLELAAWRVGEKGRFWVHAARFNPMNPVLETQVFIEDMSVATWLSILQDGEVKGEGYMYGRLPIRVDQNSEFALTFGEGFLYAKPGKGWIKLSDRPEIQKQAYKSLEEAIAALTRDAQARLLEAVNDFEFDILKFDFVRENNGIRCVVFTSGSGRTGFKQPIGGLTVNIHNFGELLSKQFLRNTDSLGAVDDVLQRIFEGR